MPKATILGKCGQTTPTESYAGLPTLSSPPGGFQGRNSFSFPNPEALISGYQAPFLPQEITRAFQFSLLLIQSTRWHRFGGKSEPLSIPILFNGVNAKML